MKIKVNLKSVNLKINKTKRKKMIKCTRYVIRKRKMIYKSTNIKSGISTIVDVSINLMTDKTPDVEHMLEQQILIYLTTNVLYFIYDSIIEYNRCNEEICEIS